jgi:hypothetical protein
MRISGNADLDLNLDLEGLMGSLTDSLTGMLSSQLDLSALMGQFAGFGNFGFYAPSPVEEEKLFDLEGSTLMTVSPQDRVSLTITLDEQDIAKAAVGQKATVKVEALSGQTFEAEVTQVSGRGVNSGGSSKFTVKLEMAKAEFDRSHAHCHDAKCEHKWDEKQERKDAERRVKLGLILAEWGTQNKVEITRDDMQHAIWAEASRYPDPKQVFEFYNKNQNALAMLRGMLFERKALDAMLTHVKTKEKKVSADDLFKQASVR